MMGGMARRSMESESEGAISGEERKGRGRVKEERREARAGHRIRKWRRGGEGGEREHRGQVKLWEWPETPKKWRSFSRALVIRETPGKEGMER